MFDKKLALMASPAADAQVAATELRKHYAFVAPDQADIMVVLGGDGQMLHELHQLSGKKLPVYGMNCGTVGFLMNDFEVAGLHERLAKTEKFILNPLRMSAITVSGEHVSAMAINEVSLLRETRQAAKIEIIIDGKTRLPMLIADGVLVATPAGSTAYNRFLLTGHGAGPALYCQPLRQLPSIFWKPPNALSALWLISSKCAISPV
jgi:NAD+ kinase